MNYENIKVGDIYSFKHTFTKENENLFSKLTGDDSYSKSVHGMLAASFFSTLIDKYCLGPESIYVSQTLKFRKPLMYGVEATIQGIILEKSDSTHMITIQTDILVSGETVVSGEAKVILRQ